MSPATANAALPNRVDIGDGDPWRAARRAAVIVACEAVVRDPSPCAMAILQLALRRLRDDAGS